MAEEYGPVSVITSGLLSRCPRCSRGRLFSGLLTVRERCEVCGLDLRHHDAGDGPAVFVVLLLGAIVVGLALWLEFRFEPPFWVHAAIWPILVIGGTIGMLRPMKATLVALQYRTHRLEQGER